MTEGDEFTKRWSKPIGFTLETIKFQYSSKLLGSPNEKQPSVFSRIKSAAILDHVETRGLPYFGRVTLKNPVYFIWLVVLTILKNISQWEGLSHISWKIKNVWNHQPVIYKHYPWGWNITDLFWNNRGFSQRHTWMYSNTQQNATQHPKIGVMCFFSCALLERNILWLLITLHVF